MATTKNLLFDLGAVLINIDFKKVEQSFVDLGVKDFAQRYSHLAVDAVFDKLETGHISPQEFYNTMLQYVDPGVEEQHLKKAWNSILLDFREESMRHLIALKERYRLFLLSNTNVIHLEGVNQILHQQLGEPNLDMYFEKAYYSHLVGMRKPNEPVFQFILQDAGIKAEETFFVDDAPPNIETARNLGFKTHLLLPGERIEHLNFDA